MKDLLELEKLQIPSAIVCSTAFRTPALAISKASGASGMPIIDIMHPMHTATKKEVYEQADIAFEKIFKALSTNPEQPSTDENKVEPREIITCENVFEANELFQKLHWTDGLPIVPPEVQLVNQMITENRYEAEKEVGIFPPLMKKGLLKYVAVNTLMAGCLQSYLPLVLSAIEAVLDEDCQLYSIQSATNAATPLIFFNGPIVKAFKINSGGNLFGTGNRANATIGRAVHLAMQNIGGELPGETDFSTHGQPGKYTFCIAEAEDCSPWEPFHVERGFNRHESVVSVVGSNGPQNIFAYGCENGEEILNTIVGAITALGNNNIIFSTGPLIVLCPEHAAAIKKSGFSKGDVKSFLFEKARIPLKMFASKTREGLLHRRNTWFEKEIDPDYIGVADDPNDIVILVAGGAGIHSQFLSTCFSKRVVSKVIKYPLIK